MGRKALILGLLVIIPVVSSFSESSVAVRAGYKTHNQIGVLGELGFANTVTAYLMPSLTLPSSDDVDILALSLGVRFYPFDGGDLGYTGYPKDRTDFGHHLSPYFSLAAQGASVSATAEQAQLLVLPKENQMVLLASIEVGLRWYLFHTLVFTKALFVDNIFLEIPIGYSLNVSSLTGLLGYQGQLDGKFPPFSVGVSLGAGF
jgi:hypothetical protein